MTPTRTQALESLPLNEIVRLLQLWADYKENKTMVTQADADKWGPGLLRAAAKELTYAPVSELDRKTLDAVIEAICEERDERVASTYWSGMNRAIGAIENLRRQPQSMSVEPPPWRREQVEVAAANLENFGTRTFNHFHRAIAMLRAYAASLPDARPVPAEPSWDDKRGVYPDTHAVLRDVPAETKEQ